MMGADDVEFVSPLYLDMMIATELLHRSHGEFLSLSRFEKKKLRLFMWTKLNKQRKERDDLKAKYEKR